jgi:hypothetical protein
MSILSASLRWRAAVSHAARQVLTARWHSTLDALECARREYLSLRAAAAVDVQAVRKSAQRLHDLEQLRAVLVREFFVGG